MVSVCEWHLRWNSREKQWAPSSPLDSAWDDPSLNADLTPGWGLLRFWGAFGSGPVCLAETSATTIVGARRTFIEDRQKSASSRRPDRADPEAMDVVLQK